MLHRKLSRLDDEVSTSSRVLQRKILESSSTRTGDDDVNPSESIKLIAEDKRSTRTCSSLCYTMKLFRETCSRKFHDAIASCNMAAELSAPMHE